MARQDGFAPLSGDASNTSDTATFVDIHELAPVNMETSGIWGGVSAQGSVGYSGDNADYYMIQMDEGGEIDVILTGMTANLDLEIHHVGPAYPGSSEISDYPGNHDENVDIHTRDGSFYIIGVTPVGNAKSNYDIRFEFLIPPFDDGDDDEVHGEIVAGNDAGSGVSGAVPVFLYNDSTALISGSVGYLDDSSDYYRFTPYADGEGVISIVGTEDDLKLSLFSGDGQSWQRTASWWEQADIFFDAKGGTNYYVKVEPLEGSESRYGLLITSPDGYGPPDEYRHFGDNQDASNEITSDFEAEVLLESGIRESAYTLYGSVGFRDDPDDYYRVFFDGVGESTIALRGLSDDASLRIYDKNGHLITQSVEAGVADESVTFSVVPNTDYYIRVDPWGDAATEYQLTINYPGDNVGAPLERLFQENSFSKYGDPQSDPSDSIDSALHLNLFTQGNAKFEGSIGYYGWLNQSLIQDTADAFSFRPLRSGTGTVTLTAESDAMRVKIYEENRLAANFVVNGGDTHSVDGAVKEGSQYNIVISSENGSHTDYSLLLETPSLPNTGNFDLGSIIPNDASNESIDRGGFFTSDIILRENDREVSGSVGFGADDTDVYQLDSYDSGIARFDLKDLTADLNIYLKDDSDQLITFSEHSEDSQESLTLWLEDWESYLIYIEPVDGAASNYNLSIESTRKIERSDFIDGDRSPINESNYWPTRTLILPIRQEPTIIDGYNGQEDRYEDTYRFIATASTEVTAEIVTYDSIMDFEIIKLENNGATYTLVHDVYAAHNEITFSVAQGEEYEFSISGKSEYTLSVYGEDPSGASPDIILSELYKRLGNSSEFQSPTDLGDALSEGDILNLDQDGGLKISGTVGFDDDADDYFSFIAAATGVANVTLTDLNDDLSLRIYDSHSQSIATSTNAGTDDESIAFGVTEGERYTIRIDPWGDAETQYSLELQTPSALNYHDFVDLISTPALEAGASMNSALLGVFDNGFASLGGTVGYNDDTIDYYKLYLEAGAYLFSLNGVKDDLSLKLYNLDGELLDSSDGTYDREELIQHTVESDFYYLRVAANGTAQSEYHLDIVNDPYFLPENAEASLPVLTGHYDDGYFL